MRDFTIEDMVRAYQPCSKCGYPKRDYTVYADYAEFKCPYCGFEEGVDAGDPRDEQYVRY